MTKITVPCEPCAGTGWATHEDRHTETRQDQCRTCGGTGQVPARPGESRETSWPDAVPGALRPGSEIVHHIRRGGLYEVLHRGATIETDRPLADDAEVIVCRRVSDGGIVVRPASLSMPTNRIALYGASVQASTPLTNGDEVVVYRSQDEGILVWVRPTSEMDDGRFEAVSAPPTSEASFQSRVDPWLIACFGQEIARDRQERAHRFLEEALELVQSAGCTAHEAHQLVAYVYGRPAGEMAQEVGGVMTTLAAFCLAHGLDMHEAGETELARIWTKVEKIRAKQAAKPKHSPLPEAASPAFDDQTARFIADSDAIEREEALRQENRRLRIALHDAIRRPMGVTPDSGAEFYDPRLMDEAEARRVGGGHL